MGLDSGSVDLGSAHGTIKIGFDEAGIGASLDRIQQTVGSRLNSLGQNFQRIGSQMTVALAPITGFAAKGILAYAEFDDILTEIQARTGATGAEMDSVRAKALQMGQDTAFSASDASQAMLELLSSGSSLNETMSMLPDVLNLAAAGNLNLGHSADAVTDILAQFQLDASQSTDVVNALAAASQSSSATVDDLIQAFVNVGPVAAGFGLSVEDAASWLAVLAENGVKGSEAGTKLKSMLNSMMSDTAEVSAAWETLNTSMVDAEGNMRPLEDVIGDINAAMDDMTEAERLGLIQDLAGTYGQTALMAFLAADGNEEMMAAMEDAAAASVLAEAKMASFRGVIRQVGSSIQTLMLNSLGPLVDNYLKPMGAVLINLINKFNAWLVLNPIAAEMVGLLIAQLAIVGPLLFAVGSALIFVSGPMLIITAVIFGLMTAVSALAVAWRNNLFGVRDIAEDVTDSVIDAFERMKTVAASGAGVIGAVLGGGGIAGMASGFELSASNALMLIRILPMLMSPLGALVVLAGAVGWAINTNFLGIGDRARPVIEGLSSAFDRVRMAAERIKTAFQSGGLQSAFQSTTEEMQSMFSELQTTGQAAFQTFFGSTLPNAIAQVQTMGPQLWSWVRDTLPQASFALGEAAGEFTRIFGDALIQYGPIVLDALVQVLSWVATTGIPEVAGLLIAMGVAFVNGFVTGLLGEEMTLVGALNLLAIKMKVWAITQGPGLAMSLLNLATTTINGFVDGVVAAAPKVLTTLSLMALGIRTWIIAQGPGIAMQLLTWATAFSQWVVAAAPGLLLRLAQLGFAISAWIGQKALDISLQMLQWIPAITNWVGQAFLWLLPKLFMFWAQLQTWIGQKALELGLAMFGWVEAFTAWAVAAQPAIREKLGRWAAAVWAWIEEQVATLSATMGQWREAMVNWVVESVPELLAALDDWVGEIETWITDQLPSISDAAAQIGDAIIDGIVGAINAGASLVTDAISGVVGGAIDTGKSILHLGSPSKVFWEMGENVIQGLALGLGDNQAVMDTMAALAHQMQHPVAALAGAGAGGGSIPQNGSSVSNYTINLQMPAEALNMSAAEAREKGQSFADGFADRLQWELRKNQ